MQKRAEASQHGGGYSRREFVMSGAAASLGAIAAPAIGRSRSKDTIRVGLIGCGGRGTGAASQALNADSDAVLWAMGDVFDDRLRKSHTALANSYSERVAVPTERQFIGFDAYQQVIDSGVDVVLLATPTHFRPEHLRAAVEAGKHVFCEKPMAVDAPGVRSIRESAESASQKRLSLVSGFCWRYHQPNRETYHRINDGAIGKVMTIHSTYHSGPLGTYSRETDWSDMEFQLRNWWHFAWLSGDHIVEQACHSIDKINWAFGGTMPVAAVGLGGRQMRDGDASGNVYDHFTVIYEYEDGSRAYHTCRQMPGCNNDNTEYITGTKGTCYVNGWGPTMVIEGENPWRYDGPNSNMYQTEHDELFASIRNGTPINDGTSMADSTMLAIIGRMACYSGQRITWEQACEDAESWTPDHYAWAPVAAQHVPEPGNWRLNAPAIDSA